MELIYGEGCTATGWKKHPDLPPDIIISKVVETLDEDEKWWVLKEIVELFGEYSDGDYCEQCGDTYYEVSLTVKE